RLVVALGCAGREVVALVLKASAAGVARGNFHVQLAGDDEGEFASWKPRYSKSCDESQHSKSGRLIVAMGAMWSHWQDESQHSRNYSPGFLSASLFPPNSHSSTSPFRVSSAPPITRLPWAVIVKCAQWLPRGASSGLISCVVAAVSVAKNWIDIPA